MEEEFVALLLNNTWDLIARPSQANVVTGKWFFKHKFHADGSLERYKARWVLVVSLSALVSTLMRPLVRL